jgi:hypothetical protein
MFLRRVRTSRSSSLIFIVCCGDTSRNLAVVLSSKQSVLKLEKEASHFLTLDRATDTHF